MHKAFQGRRIFITGHTGFKGSWLSQWLLLLGAELKGFALPPDTAPNHFDLLGLEMESQFGDIRDRETLRQSICSFRPDLVLHLAAQALVKESYVAPNATFETNVIGLVNLLDAARDCKNPVAVLNVTSDKCYENRGIPEGYKESDPMGGHDPYSASKGCAELVSASYRRSFYAPEGRLLATARAGNVVGGGDWSRDRLVPDVIRAISNKHKLRIRRPQATRPWQHVLDPLYGYLLLSSRLLAGEADYAEGWNFGTTRNTGCTVREVLESMHSSWPAFEMEFAPDDASFHEADLLQLDGAKARQRLGWYPRLDVDTTFAMTMDWYREYYEHNKLITGKQIDAFMKGLDADKQQTRDQAC